MSREEQRKQVAELAYPDVYPSSVAQRYGVTPQDQSEKRKIFISGIEWADKNPRKGLVDIDDVCRYIENCTWPIESVKDKFIFSDELRKAMDEGV